MERSPTLLLSYSGTVSGNRIASLLFPESPFLFQISNPEPALAEVAYAGTALTFGEGRYSSERSIRGFDVSRHQVGPRTMI